MKKGSGLGSPFAKFTGTITIGCRCVGKSPEVWVVESPTSITSHLPHGYCSPKSNCFRIKTRVLVCMYSSTGEHAPRACKIETYVS